MTDRACTEEQLLEAMSQYGGSFVQQLARLYRVADESNRRTIWRAFGDVFAEYAGIAAHLAARERLT